MARIIASPSLPEDEQDVRDSMICAGLLGDFEARRQRQELLVSPICQGCLDDNYEGNGSCASFPVHPRWGSTISVQAFSDLLIGKLKFLGMDERPKQILDANEPTFDWVCNSDQHGGGPRSRFFDWLEDDLPQFWISGLPGSGKSTLMKFLGQHARIRGSLQTWASPKRLLTASFYFWDSGTVLQNSKLGFLQSVLHDVLSQCPELAPIVFPVQWEAYDTFNIEVRDEWSSAELEHAFKRLVDGSASHHRLFLFIDGLDVLRGDSEDTVGFLKSFCSSSDLKICFSSRPWKTFEKAFGGGPKLVLQDLASAGIWRWIDLELGRNPSFAALETRNPGPAMRLKRNMIKKASGLFLLAELMMRSLLAGLTYGDRISDLQRRLDTLPGNLEDLLEQILNSLDALYMEHACRLILLVHAAMSNPTLLCLYFADEESPVSFAEYPFTHLTTEEIASRVETMRRRIKSRCKGLLQFTNYQTAANPTDSLLNCRVTYLHRAVKDFLLRRDVQVRISAVAGPSFNPNEALCQSCIMQLKLLREPNLLPSSCWSLIGHALEYYTRAESRATTPLTDLLDDLDRAATMRFLQTTTSAETLMQAFGGTEASASYHWTSTLTTDWKHDIVDPTASSFLNFALRCQLLSYVEAQLSREPDVPMSALLYTAVDDYQINVPDAPSCSWNRPSYKMIELLLARGANPNEPLGWTTSWDRVIEQYLPNDAKDRDLWEAIIILFLRHGAELRKAPHLQHLIVKRPRSRSQRSPPPQMNPIERLISQQKDASTYVSPYKCADDTCSGLTQTCSSGMAGAADQTPSSISRPPTYISPYPPLDIIQVDTLAPGADGEILIADLSSSRPRIMKISTSITELSSGRTKVGPAVPVELVGSTTACTSNGTNNDSSDTRNAFPKVKKAIRLRKRPGERNSERSSKVKGKEKSDDL